jgi:hypothetical protein
MELTPENLMHAVDQCLMGMNKRQRKVFIYWAKTKRLKYDALWPEGRKSEDDQSEREVRQDL